MSKISNLVSANSKPNKMSGRWILEIAIVALSYLIITGLFYPEIWQQIFNVDPPSVLTTQGESHIYEFVAEEVYQKLKTGDNPFSPTKSVLYPFGWNYAPDDVAPINGYYFMLLRPFLSIHQSFMFIVVLSVVLSCVSMYVLLRLFGHNYFISFYVGAVYGFTPFVSYRIWGHPTYVALYLFVLPVIFLVLIQRAQGRYQRLVYSILLSLSLAIFPLTNLYFTVMAALMILVFMTLGILIQQKTFMSLLLKSVNYLFISFALALLFVSSWLISVLDSIRMNGYPPASPVSDSVLLSSDLLNLIWPARNIFYDKVLQSISTSINFVPWIETLIYPGVFILVASLVYLNIRNKLAPLLKLCFITASVFYILTLGPFLRIVGHTTVLPMPFQLLYKLPFMQMARAPGRFIVPAIFLLSIVSASVLSFYYMRLSSAKKVIVSLFLVLIFLIDSIYLPFPTHIYALPDNIFKYLADHQEGPLLEIPFAIRDGIKNFGYANSVWTMRAQLYHRHPVFALYAGRVPEQAFTYYSRDALFGPLGILVNSSMADSEKILRDFDINQAEKTITRHQISYATLLENQPYSNAAALILNELKFKKIKSDFIYSLYFRE